MVMPIYDDNPFKLPHRPVVTWALIGVNIVVFFLELAHRRYPATDAQQLRPHSRRADRRGRASRACSPPVLTLVTYMFLHADWVHIFGNMLFLWVFGDNVEEALGRVRFLAFYLLCGIIGGLGFRRQRPALAEPADRRLRRDRGRGRSPI